MTTIHKFEAAGLGKAPFKFIGVQSGADRAAINRERESNGQIFTTNYATSCDYCSQGIMNAFRLRSADGKEFKVGCDCIKKSGDAGLIRLVKEEEATKRREKTRQKNIAAAARDKELVAAFNSGKCESLRSQPHPKGREGSMWDYVNWCVTNKCYGKNILQIIETAVAR